MATESSQARSHFGSISFREIHKNAWLKRIYQKKKREKMWVVFCVHDDSDAFLETYIDNKVAVLHKPNWHVYLNEIQHISPTICPNEQEYEFVLTLKNEVVRFTAQSWDQMLDWVTSLQLKLQEMKILSPKDNLYSRAAEPRGPLLSTRDPNSPLPPPPTTLDELLPGVEGIEIETRRNGRGPELSRQMSTPLSQTSSLLDTPQLRRGSTSVPEVFTFENISSEDSTNNSEPSNYEYLFNLQSNPGPSNREDDSSLQRPPAPYKTFREQQALHLQKEMQHSGGVRVQLRRKDCVRSIAFVDAFESVWICGWKQKVHPQLYNALHVGDRIISIAGISVENANEAYRVLQSHYCSLYVDILIRRVPFGQVFLFHRETEGQPLGIVQENNTAVIETVEENSLAARQGLTAKTKTCDGLSLTNWVLTEINGRPLNLFFKKNQIRDRLNCVGREISVLVQPLDLVKQLKKELKAFKNYKEYILQ